MCEIVILRPRIEELDMIYDFFQVVLKDTFEVNGISNFKDLMEEEIEDKRKCINQDFETNGRDRFFLLAKCYGKIIGSIEYGLSNELLNRCTSNELKDLFEIGTVFVHPGYQKRGVSNLLLYHLFKELKNKTIEDICFDSGYQIAQKIWVKKFGNPLYFLKDYWGENSHHMVWKVNVYDGLEICRSNLRNW